MEKSFSHGVPRLHQLLCMEQMESCGNPILLQMVPNSELWLPGAAGACSPFQWLCQAWKETCSSPPSWEEMAGWEHVPPSAWAAVTSAGCTALSTCSAMGTWHGWLSCSAEALWDVSQGSVKWVGQNYL